MSCDIKPSPSCRPAGDAVANPDPDLGTADPGQDRPDSPIAGWTVSEVAERYRVNPDKVRAWIAKGELAAVNTAGRLCGKPRWVIPPEALPQFEKARRGGPVPKPQRRRRLSNAIDFFPD